MAYTKDTSLTTNAFYTTSTYRSDIGLVQQSRPNRKFKIWRSRTGNANPIWYKQVLAHENATTSMSGEFETIFARSGSWGKKIKSGSIKFTYQAGGLLSFHRYCPSSDTHPNPSLAITTARNRAMSKAFQQVRKEQIAMSGGTFLGELGEAIHMIRHPAEGLRRALKSDYLDKLQKIKKADPNKWKKAISQTWLEGCFGWRPFINDLEDAMLAYEKIRDDLGGIQFKHIRAVGKDDKLVYEDAADSFPTHSDLYVLGHNVIRDEATVIIRGEVKRQAVSTAMDKARVFGLTPSEFLPTAWELLPWSFLADYFTNIGDIISAGATDTSNIAWLEIANVQCRKQEATCKIDYDKNAQLGGADVSDINGKPDYVEFKRRIVTRSKLPDLSVPPLAFELPGGSIKQLNMLALFTQANSISPQDPRKLRGRSF